MNAACWDHEAARTATARADATAARTTTAGTTTARTATARADAPAARLTTARATSARATIARTTTAHTTAAPAATAHARSHLRRLWLALVHARSHLRRLWLSRVHARSRLRRFSLALALAAVGIQAALAADIGANALQNKTIGYVATDFHWAIYQTPSAKSECPKGFNEGPREQFSRLYPNHGKRTLSDTQLHLETETWFPTGAEDSLPFHQATGRISYGLNLDGKVGPNDFTSPDGEPGIDNQLFRVLGCVIGYRAPDGVEYIFGPKAIVDSAYNRTMIELTGVDSLVNDDDVTVTVYRGLDRLLTDASGNKIMPGGSQRVDVRWGRPFIQHYRGKIVGGVLITEPGEFIFPWMTLRVPTYERLHDMRMRLKLTASAAEGLIAGYTDVETWYTQLIRNDSTHHLSNGQISALSLHKALHQLADAYPDPNNGANTAISSALDVKFTQVFIRHPEAAQANAALRK